MHRLPPPNRPTSRERQAQGDRAGHRRPRDRGAATRQAGCARLGAGHPEPGTGTEHDRRIPQDGRLTDAQLLPGADGSRRGRPDRRRRRMDQPAPGGTTMTIRHLVLRLAPAPASTRMWLWLLAGVLPAMVAGVLFGYLAAQGRMAPTAALAGFAAIVLPALLVGIAIGKQMRGHRLVLRARDVGLVTGTYRQLLAYPELELDRARVLDLDEHLEFRPRLKTSAMVLP